MDLERFESLGMLTEKEEKSYIFFTDPGHGWLEVELSELVELDIVDKISAFSYIHGDYAYLEEDCDAGIFIKAMFGDDASFSELERRGILTDRHQEYTPIRNYRCFDKNEVNL